MRHGKERTKRVKRKKKKVKEKFGKEREGKKGKKGERRSSGKGRKAYFQRSGSNEGRNGEEVINEEEERRGKLKGGR